MRTFRRSLPESLAVSVALLTAYLSPDITLSYRAAGPPDGRLMVFLHGFPEAAFVWDDALAHFSQAAHDGFRCIAPNLRGFERSSASREIAAYRPDRLVDDLMRLALQSTPDGVIDTLVAHDWGGAIAWLAASLHPLRIRRLVILNAPHAGPFSRALREDPAQQQASAYMNWLSRPDAEERLVAHDFSKLFHFFSHGRLDKANPSWLTESVKEKYRQVWASGLTGACNLYRATPLKPPLDGVRSALDIPLIEPPHAMVSVPTLVLWGEEDAALPLSLLQGLGAFVPQLQVRTVAGATHWIVHEELPQLLQAIGKFASDETVVLAP